VQTDQALGDSTSVGARYVTWGSARQIGGEIKVRFQNPERGLHARSLRT
jgi:hypothetical protein